MLTDEILAARGVVAARPGSSPTSPARSPAAKSNWEVTQ